MNYSRERPDADRKTPSNEGASSIHHLGQFFHLLLRIDRRNNPGLYESNKLTLRKTSKNRLIEHTVWV